MVLELEISPIPLFFLLKLNFLSQYQNNIILMLPRLPREITQFSRVQPPKNQFLILISQQLSYFSYSLSLLTIS